MEYSPNAFQIKIIISIAIGILIVIHYSICNIAVRFAILFAFQITIKIPIAIAIYPSPIWSKQYSQCKSSSRRSTNCNKLNQVTGRATELTDWPVYTDNT